MDGKNNEHEHFGYIVLPQGSQDKSNGYRIVENIQNKSITLIPIGDKSGIELKGPFGGH